jgi:hypothetical protein
LIDTQQTFASVREAAGKVIGRRWAAERIDNQAAREITDGMASHAVGDCPASPFGLLETGVFIVLAHAAHI